MPTPKAILAKEPPLLRGDKTIWHVFYAEGTKSRQFSDYSEATKFLKKAL